jgi:hypothetical protein
VPRQLEFHDSDLIAVTHAGDDVVLTLQGYVHQWDVVDGEWAGWGWTMPVVITISSATAVMPSTLGEIADGTLIVGSTTYENMVPLPLVGGGEVKLELSIADALVRVHGRGVSVDVAAPGETRRVEALPDSWRPADA